MRLTLVSLAAATASLALAGQAFAQSPDTAKIPAGAYTVEPTHTRVLFAVNHMGFSTYYGEFSGPSGALNLDPASPASSSVTISIPTASVSTTNAKLDGELKSANWLDAGQFPTITFKSTKVVPTGPNTAKITGDLTLHGVTRPVVLDATLHGSGVNMMDKKFTVGFDAVAHITRSDYGVKTYVPLIGDQVDVIISAAFEKAN